MEIKPDSIDIISKAKRISHKITKKLEESHKVDKNSKRNYEKTIWQEKMKFIRTEDNIQCVVGS